MVNPYKRLIQAYKAKLLTGRVLAIDPGSISPGWALFEGGLLKDAGTKDLGKAASIYSRLPRLHSELADWLPDVLVIEQIRGSMAHEYLKWSVGVAIAAANTSCVIELPIHEWQKFSKNKASYFKDDTQDAIIIGETAIYLAGA
jgi:hypothetical protein